MKIISKLGVADAKGYVQGCSVPDEFKAFFFSPFDFDDFLTINDPTHLATKMFWKLMKDPPLLGMYRASAEDIRTVIKDHRKNLHFGPGIITDVVDVMNFTRVAPVCCESFIKLLTLPEHQGTKFYLTLIQYVIDAYIDPTLTPMERIRKAWYVVLFCREWRIYVEMCKDTKVKDDFITSNAFNCIELNAHNLIKFLMICRETNHPEMFLVHLLSSQDCEAFFRILRSLGTTNYTVINFTMDELLHKIRRVLKMSHIEITHGITRKSAVVKGAKTFVPDHLPSNKEIEKIVIEVYKDVVKDLESLGN